MQNCLTEQEKQTLKILEKSIKNKTIAIRIRVILALSEGYNAKDVAKILLLDEDTVTKWKQKFEDRKYLSDWLAREYRGYVGRVSKPMKKDIDAYVSSGLVVDCAEVVEFVKKKYGILYTVSGMTKLLSRLGFVYKSTVLIPSKADIQKQAEFIAKYEELSRSLTHKQKIFFGDGVHPTHNTQKTKCWVKKGENKQVKANTGRSRLNINGVLDMDSMDTVVHFDTVINAQTTIKLFDKIQTKYVDYEKLYIIVDNARYYKNHALEEYLSLEGCKIELVFLPPYSPNLNFIERLWKYMKKYMKKYIIGGKYRERFSEFEKCIHDFFNNIGDYEKSLRKFIGTEFHLLE